ncbi:MAG: hypothetical protein HUK11_04815 [Muribaculaceae bacterium]|nr:hypothetical protein [Muribaculaceae bacterium]
MENIIVISQRTISRMKNMSVEERKIILDTLFCDEILGVERTTLLTPLQELVYCMFRNNVINETRHYKSIPSQAIS